MTTMKNPLANAKPLPILRQIRAGTPLVSSYSTVQSILPDILSTTVLQKRRTQKRVRFALKLEPVEEELSSSTTTKPNKRIIDPWREDGPLYGAYVEYLEKEDTLTPDITETNRPSRPPPSEPTTEPSNCTHTFVIQSKSPELVIDSITISAPPLHLPRIIHRTSAPTPKKPTNNKRQSLPLVDSYLKQRLNAGTPPRHSPTRKITNSVNNNTHYSSIKRVDATLPTMKYSNTHDKSNRTENSLRSKSVNDHIQSKKFTEVITKPLPGTNNQINQFSEHSTIFNLSNKSPVPYQNDDTYFFQNHNSDHFQPIIHSTH